MSIYSPFFYIIKHKPSGMQYAGARWSVKSDPNRFMCKGGYQTSSNTVKLMIAKDGLDSFEVIDIILEEEVQIPFGWDDIRTYETWFLETNDCASSELWLNNHNNAIGLYNTKHTSMLKKLGVSYARQLPKNKERWKQLCIERFGVSNISYSEEVQAKKVRTCLENFGVEYPMQSAEVMERSRKTSMEKYGVAHPAMTKQVKDSMKQTCLEKYGVDHYSKNGRV